MREPLRTLVEEETKRKDPFDLRPELDRMRALYRFVEGKKGALDVDLASRLLAEASRMVERIERIRNANAISRPDLYRLMQEMGRAADSVINLLVKDETLASALKQKIHDTWLGIKV